MVRRGDREGNGLWEMKYREWWKEGPERKLKRNQIKGTFLIGGWSLAKEEGGRL